ncbi:PspC domain-containing protein [Agromyces sp. MMS17-SY077]|uniref:PspC domain-containing protein n=2 Tax=Agromyces seonyuensis TaxID=2662446 RepID=A0A6I4P0G7_9MICO|nr:PspC domain-containing protein [Agromyces seonyuensis]MWC00134.1 PspC domain-containing protein [Agromyces seonyuensis]
MRPPLTRPRACLLSGVSAGLARHLGLPVWVVRAVFVATAFLGGAGVYLYLWFWCFTPWDALPGGAGGERAERAPVTRTLPVAWLLLGAAAVSVVLSWLVLGTAGLLTSFGFLALLLVAGAGAWSTFADRADPGRGRGGERAVRIAGAILLGVMLVVAIIGAGSATEAALSTLLVALAAALLFAPLLLAQWRELGRERTKRIREEQRAEMAAHLHDSVLQTLALIQHRSGATSEVGRIARAQERELREWLYAGDSAPDADLATDLRDWAAALEIDYAVTFDVVVVGGSGERASGELAAAAREAMLNAARHAGGEVSVYLEGSPTRVEVFVRDRGPGFDPADVPGDRLGVRESIIGRMRRAGGRAEVRPGKAGGTEVHLVFETPDQNRTGGAHG